MRISALVPVFLFGALLGCDGGGPGAVGAPCNTADDCEDGLICDEHNDQGSCQQPHGHTGGETSDGSDSDSATTTASTSTTTASDTGTPDETSTGSDTDGAESSGVTTDDPTTGETSGNSELCMAYCGCMQSTCTSYEGYPYADEAACITACEALDGIVLQCFGGFCEQAVNSEGTLIEHYCQHAWGELGNEKC